MDDAADGDEKPKRRGRAKAKAKGKARAKASPKPKAVAKAKSSPKAKAKARTGKKPQNKDQEEVVDGAGVADASVAESHPETASKKKRPRKTVEPSGPAGESKANSKKGKKTTKAPEAIPQDEPEEEKKPSEKQKCFARRRRPASHFAALKWDSLCQAFRSKVQPLLKTYSAHEDWAVSKVVSFGTLLAVLCCWD